jgi:hypothetical protein
VCPSHSLQRQQQQTGGTDSGVAVSDSDICLSPRGTSLILASSIPGNNNNSNNSNNNSKVNNNISTSSIAYSNSHTATAAESSPQTDDGDTDANNSSNSNNNNDNMSHSSSTTKSTPASAAGTHRMHQYNVEGPFEPLAVNAGACILLPAYIYTQLPIYLHTYSYLSTDLTTYMCTVTMFTNMLVMTYI